MDLIHGITVQLLQKTANGYDDMHIQKYTEAWVSVDNVIVGQPTSQELTDTITLYGKRATYSLCIPKGDSHNWQDTRVKFFGQEWRTIGPVKQYIEDMLPLSWNKQVLVENNGD